MTKNEIADVLNEIAVLLELKGENPFKTRAYQMGAKTLEALDEDLGAVIADGRLRSMKGIGEALAKKITELHATGRLAFFDELKASVAPGLVEMLEIPGVGAKKIKVLYEKLGVASIDALNRACLDGLVAELPGFGAKTQEKILQGIKNRIAYGKRHLWWDAYMIAEPILEGLRALPQVERAEHAGSLRRGLETVGDLDFIVAAREIAPVFDWFTSQPGVSEVTAKGETKASVRFGNGLQADLRIVPLDQFYFALHHFTGSKDHNVQMRQRALERELSLSEWGLVPASGEGTAKAKAAAGVRAFVVRSEADLFAALGLNYIPPELREGLGEIEYAEKQAIPTLVTLEDLRGAFHCHTTESDGRNTLNEMAAAADALGWEYFGVADHSKSSFQANGLTAERLVAQVEVIRALNTSKRLRTHVFAGTECDVLADGTLDFPDDVLAQLDYVVASVHNAFAQNEETITARIIRAVENPHVTMLGHVTGRLLLRREGYAVNVGKVIDASIANGVIIELNATPQRLDMDWRHWRKAAERGLLCAINPDAHETSSLSYLQAGVNAARKGWLRPENILNTRPLAEVQAYLAQRRASAR